MMIKILNFELPIAFAAVVLWASQGTGAESFPIPTNSEKEEIPLRSAQESANAIKVPDGFHVSVFASEPEIRNPIAMTWDFQERLWVAENYTYAERPQKFDLSFRDRVVVLKDSDHDGIADQRTVFTDQVQMLTSVEVGHGGVWLMCPPRVLFIPDRNHDLVPDGPAEVVLDGFEVAKQNYHNFANGLRWGPDGWLYGRCGGSCPGRIGVPGTPAKDRIPIEGGIWRFHPQRKTFEVLTHGTTNPWGHDWNAYGEGFFINTVNGHLWHLIPGAHLMRPFTLDPNTKTYELLDMHADHWHFDTGMGWQKSRDGVANSFGGGHAHTGMMIYQGDNWPDRFRGRLFTWNMHGFRANQEILHRRGSGYVGKHGEDMLQSSDPFFRPIDMNYGPDGAVYVNDWTDIGECHENSGVHRTSGRIYRVSYLANESTASPRRPDLRTSSNRALVSMHSMSSEWFVRKARLILAERSVSGQDLSESIRTLKEMIGGANEVNACRSLLTLYNIQGADREFLVKLLRHDSEHVRTLSIRLLTDHWPIDDIFGPNSSASATHGDAKDEAGSLMATFTNLANNDTSGLVRLALASTIQRLPVELRPQLAAALMDRSEDADDHNLPLVVWYGLIPVAKENPAAFTELGIGSRWPKTQRFIVRRLAEDIESQGKSVEKLLAAVAEATDNAVRENMLRGMEDGLRGWRKAPKPANWDAVVSAIANTGNANCVQLARSLSVVFGDGRALDAVRQIVLDKEAEIGLRRSALETMVKSAAPGLRDVGLEVLDDPRLNVIAAQGLTLFDDPEVAQQLIRSYGRFRAPERPKVISLLVSRASFANVLLNAISEEKIPVDDLTAFDVRQIRSLNEAELTRRVTELWGEIRKSPLEKLARIQSFKKMLTPESIEKANRSHGRVLFNQTCAKCHRMYGQGDEIGPDLTGSNRHNLDYLLENILDPSAVVTKDFRMSILALVDGRTLNGLIVEKTEKTITLQTQTDRQTVQLTDIDFINTTNLSPMPDGLLDNLSEPQIRDLIAYLMHPSQIELPAGQ